MRAQLIAKHGADHDPPQLHRPNGVLLWQEEQACALVLSLWTSRVEPSDTLVLRTADQGQHWTAERLTGSYVAHDARGWLLTHLDAGGQLPLLYQTADGGQHWTEHGALTAPLSQLGVCCFLAGSRLRFTSERSGEVWIEDLNPAPSAPTHYRLRTEDGGAVWRIAEQGTAPPDIAPQPEPTAPRWCSVEAAARALSADAAP